jgi:hypothetical protein
MPKSTPTVSHLMMIADKSATGMTQSLKMQVDKDDWVGLIKAMRKGVINPIGGVSVMEVSYVKEDGGKETTAHYQVSFLKGDGSETSAHYKFVRSNQNYFLNVSCNPTILAIGGNTFPALITGAKEYEGKHPAHSSFMALNRLAFDILGKRGFKAVVSDKFWQRVLDGDILIHDLQLACYSKDLGENRDLVMIAIRKLLGGQINLREANGRSISASLSSLLNTRFTAFDNDRCNFSFTSMSGGAKEFNLTCYRKDKYLELEEMTRAVAKKGPAYSEIESEGSREAMRRVEGSIRFDLTLSRYWLERSLKISTVADLERVYFEKCEEAGYDSGFMNFIMNEIFARLKLTSLLSVDRKVMMASLDDLDGRIANARAYMAGNQLAENKSRMLTNVLFVAYFDGLNLAGKTGDLISLLNREYKVGISRGAEGGDELDVQVAKAKVRRLLDSTYSLDIDVPWQFFMAALVNADNSNYTLAEMRELAFGSDNQERVSLLELRKRTAAMMDVIAESIFSKAKQVGLKRYVPIEIGYKDCHIFKMLGA